MNKDTTDNKNQIRANSDGETSIITFTVYGEPIPKLRARTVRCSNGYGGTSVRTFTPLKTREYEEKIAGVYKAVYGGFRFQKGAPLLMSARFFLKIPKNTSKKAREKMMAGEIRPTKRPDTDNLMKAVQDGMNGLAYEDDSQIVRIIGEKYYSAEPRTEILVATIENEMKTNEYGEKLDRNGYAPSIFGRQDRCYLCGRRDRALQRHEVWHGPNREKSKRLGLWVNICDLCHDRLHHKEGQADADLKKRMQKVAMDYYNWDVEEFRRVVGKSYI